MNLPSELANLCPLYFPDYHCRQIVCNVYVTALQRIFRSYESFTLVIAPLLSAVGLFLLDFIYG